MYYTETPHEPTHEADAQIETIRRAEILGWSGAYFSLSSFGWRLQLIPGLSPRLRYALQRDAEAAAAFLVECEAEALG